MAQYGAERERTGTSPLVTLVSPTGLTADNLCDRLDGQALSGLEQGYGLKAQGVGPEFRGGLRHVFLPNAARYGSPAN